MKDIKILHPAKYSLSKYVIKKTNIISRFPGASRKNNTIYHLNFMSYKKLGRTSST